MRILVVGINYAPDLIGVAKYNTELCEGLVAEGHEVEVVTAPPYYPAWSIPEHFSSSYFRARESNGVKVTRSPIYVPANPTGAKRLLHHASFAATSTAPVLAKAMKWRPHVMISIAPSLLSAAFVAFVARRIGAKSWLHLQDFEVDAAFDLGLLKNARLRAPMIYVEQRVLKAFDRVSTISPQMLHRLGTKGVAPHRLRELRNWIDTSMIVPGHRQTRFRREVNLNDAHVVGLYAGTMSNKQGLDLIIDVASMLGQSHPHIQFMLCGDGPHRAQLMAMASDRPNVHFLGLQPGERFSELLATADFHLIPQKAAAADLVLPSKLGGILSSNRPVIAMADERTGLADEVREVGLLVPPGDTRGLADAVCRLDADSALRDRLGDNARKRALERWDRQAILNAWSRELIALASERDDPLPASAARPAKSNEAVSLAVSERAPVPPARGMAASRSISKTD